MIEREIRFKKIHVNRKAEPAKPDKGNEKHHHQANPLSIKQPVAAQPSARVNASDNPGIANECARRVTPVAADVKHNDQQD
ncbi:hypothetical protein GCM10028816_49900 [Spirosoma lituiforme]